MRYASRRAASVRDASFLIVAVARDGTIGKDGGIPWDLPSDLRHFRRATIGCAVVMGRRTFDSLPGPLRGRLPVVITSRPLPRGVLGAASFEEAVAIAERSPVRAVAFAGGASVYRAALSLPWLGRAAVTSVDCAPAGDVAMPPMGPGWRKGSSLALDPGPRGTAARVDLLTRSTRTRARPDRR